MDKHISETCISTPDVEKTAELLCAVLGDWSFSVSINQSEWLLDFDDGRVVVSPAVGGLHLRVEATDPLTLLGMRSVLQVAFSQVSAHLFSELDWHPADGELLGVTGPLRGTARCR